MTEETEQSRAEERRSAAESAQEKVDRAQEIYSRQGKIVRGLWVAAAVVVILAGIAMIVVPGPVTVVVPVGLAMLSVVFGWARRLLLQSVDKGVLAKQAVEDASTKAKILGGVAAVCLAGAAAGAAAAWLL